MQKIKALRADPTKDKALIHNVDIHACTILLLSLGAHAQRGLQ